MKPRVLWVVESVTVDGWIVPVDGERGENTTFTERSEARWWAAKYKREDKAEGIDTQIRVTKYVQELPKPKSSGSARSSRRSSRAAISTRSRKRSR